jgi:hypothetical protein
MSIKAILLGKPLKNNEIKHEKLTKLWGLPIMASDAMSSVAYAGEEILMVLVPVLGLASFKVVPLGNVTHHFFAVDPDRLIFPGHRPISPGRRRL